MKQRQSNRGGDNTPYIKKNTNLAFIAWKVIVLHWCMNACNASNSMQYNAGRRGSRRLLPQLPGGPSGTLQLSSKPKPALRRMMCGFSLVREGIQTVLNFFNKQADDIKQIQHIYQVPLIYRLVLLE